MSTRAVSMLVLFVALGVGAAAYMLGVAHGSAVSGAPVTPIQVAQPVQSPFPEMPAPFQGPAPAPQPFQAPAPQTPQQAPGQAPPLREFIPIPGPGDQNPGMRPQQQNGEGECEPIILFYHNGQLYQMRPGQGPQDGQGRPGTPPEFFPLNPYQGPPIPGLPLPRPDRGPGFTPLNPRS